MERSFCEKEDEIDVIEYIFNIFICTLTIISLFGNGQYISIHPLAIGVFGVHSL